MQERSSGNSFSSSTTDERRRDGRVTRLAALLAEADFACGDRDPAVFASSLRDARADVDVTQLPDLLRVIELSVVDFDSACARWTELRPQLRVRREPGT
jgi:hypothetical protein